MLLAQTIEAAYTAKTFADRYGELAFGVMAFLVIMSVLVIIYQKIIAPAHATTLRIAEINATTAKSLENTSASLERQVIENRIISENLKRENEE